MNNIVVILTTVCIARSPEQALFSSMIIKCVVQLELIQAIENIVFYPNTTRQEDQDILSFSQVISVEQEFMIILDLLYVHTVYLTCTSYP